MLKSCMRLCMTCSSRRSATHALASVRSLATSPTASVTSLRVLPALATLQSEWVAMSHQGGVDKDPANLVELAGAVEGGEAAEHAPDCHS